MALTKCKECRHKVSTKAETCPHCGAAVENAPERKTSFASGCLSVIVVGGIVAWLVSYDFDDYGEDAHVSPSTPSQPAQASPPAAPPAAWKPENNPGLAYTMMKDFVTEQLKSPGSAKFPGMFDQRKHTKTIGPGTYEIASWVDSQNAFGATMRKRFTGKVEQTGDYEWRLLSLEFEEQ